jgi:flavin-dependent dehydrogenase
VVQRAERSSVLQVLSPRGIAVPISGEFQVLRRRELDERLFQQAIAAGATYVQASVKGPIEEGGRVVGVTIEDHGAMRELRAPLTILATGAEAAILKKFDAGARSEASGYAIRTYATIPNAPSHTLFISLERDLLPGYAWAFPGPNGVWNVGVGVFYASNLRDKQLNLRARMDDFLAGRGNLARLLGPMTPTEKYTGAPLRTGLAGSSLGRDGLAIIGDAAGTTYGLTGEGIGKSMESGLLAASIAAERRGDLASVGPIYRDRMRADYADRFRTYEIAERWMRVPAFADLVAWRANRSAWVLTHLTRVLTEDTLPNRVFSAKALWALLTR